MSRCVTTKRIPRLTGRLEKFCFHGFAPCVPRYSLLAGLVGLGVVAAGVEPGVAALVLVLVSAVEPDFVSPEEPESVAGEVALSVLLLAPVPEPEVLLVPALSVL